MSGGLRKAPGIGSRFGLVGLVVVVSLAAGCGRSGPTAAQTEAIKYVELGKDAHFEGDTKKGLAAYNKAIRIDPKCRQAFVCRGMLHQETGSPEKAMADFTKAIQLDPGDSYPYEQRASIYRDHYHDEAKAVADEEKAFALRQEQRDEMRKRVKGK